LPLLDRLLCKGKKIEKQNTSASYYLEHIVIKLQRMAKNDEPLRDLLDKHQIFQQAFAFRS